MNSAVLVLLASFCLVTSSRFLQSNETAVTPSDLTYVNTLPCGTCIMRGFTSCTPDSWGGGAEHQSAVAPDPAWGTCTTTLSADPAWLCTDAYSSRAYAKYLCYYDATACGSTWNFTLEEGDSKTVTIANLQNGRTCFYAVKGSCAAPAFNVNATGAGAGTATTFEVEWIEFDDSALNNSAYQAVGASDTSTSPTLRASPPMKDYPPRNARFSDGLGSAKIYMQDQSGTANTNQPVGKAGRWSQTKGGKKVYSVDDQGDTAQVSLDKGDEDQKCDVTRYQYISVTAVGANLASLTLTLTGDEIMVNSGYLMGACSIIVAFFAAYLL